MKKIVLLLICFSLGIACGQSSKQSNDEGLRVGEQDGYEFECKISDLPKADSNRISKDAEFKKGYLDGYKIGVKKCTDEIG